MNVLLTGATGFLGREISKQLQTLGHTVFALVRRENHGIKTSPKLVPVIGSLDDSPDRLREKLISINFDAVLHCAGGSLGLSAEDVFHMNLTTTETLISAVKNRRGASGGPLPFVLVSSIAAGGPHGNQSGAESRPVSLYGRAKLESERALYNESTTLHGRVLRLPTIYGAGDHRIGGVVEWVKNRPFIFLPNPEQRIHMVSHTDAAAACVALTEATSSSIKQSIYCLNDGTDYTAKKMVELIAEFHQKQVRILKLPSAFVRGAGAASELVARLTKRATYFHRDKTHDLLAESWLCDAEPFFRDFGFAPKTGFRDFLTEVEAAGL